METSSEKLDLNTRQGINWERAEALVGSVPPSIDTRLIALQRRVGRNQGACAGDVGELTGDDQLHDGVAERRGLRRPGGDREHRNAGTRR